MDISTDLNGLLAHPGLRAILVFDTPNGPALPHASVPEELWQAKTGPVKSAFEPVFGVPFNVIYCLGFADHEENQPAHGLYLLELRQPDSAEPLPAGARWLPLADAQPEKLLPAKLIDAFLRWKAEYTAQTLPGTAWQPPEFRPAWAMPGWYARAEAWIREELARDGQTVLAVEPVKSWCISVVLRVQITGRSAFFKASRKLPLFANEGAVMRGLAALYPGHIPAPWGINDEQGWMLLDDLGAILGREPSVEQQAALWETMSRIQIDSTNRLDHLLRAGCLDRRIAWLQTQLDGLLADERTVSPLEPDEREALFDALPRLQALLTELEALPIPPALVHGDLHTGNAVMRDGKILLFDWTDAAVTHPFFDLMNLYNHPEPGERAHFAGLVRSLWEQHYPPDAVQRSMDLARVTYGLYHAISYQSIANHLEESDRPILDAAYLYLRGVLSELRAFKG